MDRHRPIYVLVGCLILVAGGICAAQDWPQWRGPNRDGKASGFVVPETWPEKLTQNWRVIVGVGDASPVLAAGRLYIHARQGNEEIIMCLDAGTGDEIWRHGNPAPNVGGCARSHPGPRSTPVVADGKVVTLGAGGILTCLNVSGRVLWSKDPLPGIVPRFFAAMSPLVVGGSAIAHLGGAGNGALIAYDLETGGERWRWTEDGPEYSSPVLMAVGGVFQVVTLTEKGIVGVSIVDGSLLWRLPFPPRRMAVNCTTPIIYGQTVIYTGQNRGTIAVKIERQGDEFTATEVWNQPAHSTWYSTPIRSNNMLFGLSQHGRLFCLSAITGTQLWINDTKHDRFGTIIQTGSVFMVIAPRSPLIVFNAGTLSYNEIASYKVAATPVYAHPAVAGNAIYIKDQESVIKWTVE